MSKMCIWVDNSFVHHDRLTELRTKGHTIVTMGPFEDGVVAPLPDLILHPKAWRWDDSKWEFLEVALKEARKGQPRRVKSDPKAGNKPRSRKGSKRSAG